MSQSIKSTNIATKTVVPASSRYINGSVIYYGQNNLLTFPIYVRVPYVKSGNEKVMLISKGVEYRPDLVSYQVYGFVDNWWRIMEANGIFDVFDFTAGKTIILPNKVM